MRRRNQKKRLEKASRDPGGAPVSSVGEMEEQGNGHPQESRSGASGSCDRWMVLGVCGFLIAITLAVFGQTLSYEFTNFDDNVYIYRDPVVTRGLTFDGVKAAFSTRHSDNWVPLTTLSHMLDCQLFGLNAGDHHLTNVLLQTATAILLFLALREMTGFLWRSAFIAAVFAIHPLRVESVAWISERKDVLSGVFFMLTLWAYVRYVRSHKPFGWYLATLLLFILALLSKPSVVTLPFVLLLLDYWPLKRFNILTLQPFNSPTLLRLILEKIPFLLLSLACCLPTVLAERAGIKPLEFYPLPLRIENAIVSYVIQLWRMVCPVHLAALYPYPGAIPWWEVALAGMLLAGICAIVWAQQRTRPWLLVGWLWYLGMLLPNIGLIQLGFYSRADRYTYLPQIGLYLALVWAAVNLCVGWRYRREILGGCSAIILVALIFCAHRQAAYWRNSETLWTRALACTSDNFIAHRNLGDALLQKGKLDEAIVQYQTALQLNPDDAIAYGDLGNALVGKGDAYVAGIQFQKALQIDPDNLDAHYNFGSLLLTQGNVDGAIAQYQKALQLNPDNLEIHYELGNALLQKGDFAAAIEHYQKALPVELNNAEAHLNLGSLLLNEGNVDEAIAQYQQALQIKPDDADIHKSLGNALFRKGDVDAAIVQFQQALQIEPTNAGDNNNLAWALATAPQASLRNGIQAVDLAQKASELAGGNNPVILHTLAAAYAEAGRFDEARRTAQQAIELAQSAGQQGLVDQLTMELKLYTAGLPYHMGNK